MTRKIYDIGLQLFPILLRLVSPFHKKARLMIAGRTDWELDLKAQIFTDKRVWFHCASLGEFEQGRPLMEKIKKLYPNHSVIVTFFSPSGYEVKKDFDQADYVCYLPFDGTKSSKKFINILKPDIAVFIKYEFWYYYLKELKNNQIPTFSISAIFRENQRFFKKNGTFFREMLTAFHHFFVQNHISRQLLNCQGFNNVTVAGDTRFDRVVEICEKPKSIELVEIFKGSNNLLVVGSSWPEDIEVLLPILNDTNSKLKIIIAPHEVEKENIRKLSKYFTVDFQLLSSANIDSIQQSKILIIDSIGLLSSLYQYGEMAYIGGAFGDGLHNILEAATYGMPIFFGKGKDNYKYQEAVDLLDLGAAFEISNTMEMSQKIDELLVDQKKLEAVSAISKNYVQSNTGATKIILDHLQNFLN